MTPQTFTQHYTIQEVTGYINWLYFFHAWNFPAGILQENSPRALEARKLQQDARLLLQQWDRQGRHTHFRVTLLEAYSDGEDIVLPEVGKRLPLLRQQHPGEGEPCLCLSDFVRPLSQHIPDRIGLFASTVDSDLEQQFPDDDYRHLLAQTLADRLAEATAEVGHQQTRRQWWGYAPDENLTPPQLFQEKYQGKRPAVGYPSLPDQSLNFVLDELIDMRSLGIQLTENGAMQPHASTSGLMLSHPAARHFAVGRVGEDQLLDYARRRGVEVSWLRKFFSN